MVALQRSCYHLSLVSSTSHLHTLRSPDSTSSRLLALGSLRCQWELWLKSAPSNTTVNFIINKVLLCYKAAQVYTTNLLFPSPSFQTVRAHHGSNINFACVTLSRLSLQDTVLLRPRKRRYLELAILLRVPCPLHPDSALSSIVTQASVVM